MINRRDFIKATALAAGVAMIPFKSIFASFADEPKGTFRRLLQDVGYFTYKGGTIGWLIVKDTIIIVDSQFPDAAAEFMKHVRKMTNANVSALINTHHHYDHTSGNAYFKPFTDKIVAHKRCVELQKEQLGKKDKNIVTADTTFTDTLRLDFGVEQITLNHYGPAHTGGDSVVYFEKNNHLHVGDLVFNKAYPWFDSKDGGSLRNWVNVLNRCIGDYPRDAIYIFGHAVSDEYVVGEQPEVLAMRDYFNRLLDFVEKEIKSGKKKNKIISNTAIPGVNDRKELWPGALKSNLISAYDEVIKERKK